MKYEILQENSAFTEVLYGILVADLKEELVSVIIRNDEEEYESDEKACEAMENNCNKTYEKYNVKKWKVIT